MGSEYLQSDLSGGELAETLHARADIDKYAKSVALAKNMVIVPQGGMRRRPGLAKIDDGYYSEDVRLEPFIFNQSQKYIMIFRAGFVDIMKDSVKIASDIAIPYLTMEIVDELDIIQSADTVIVTHETVHPQKLTRGIDDTQWTIEDIILEIPSETFDGYSHSYENQGNTQVVDLKKGDIVWNNDGNNDQGENNNYYKSLVTEDAVDLSAVIYTNTSSWEDLNTSPEPVWSETRGYPGVCVFHGGRLWFAGSTQKPTTVWASRVNGFFDFTWVETSGSIPEDHAISDTIDTGEYNKITNIFANRKLQVFTTGAEFINTEDFPTPAKSNWQQQTGYGSKRLRPVTIDGATLFVDSSNRTIRQFMFSFDEDAFVSNNITLLAAHLLTDIKALKTIKGTRLDVSDYVYAVNSDGTIAVMNTLRSEGLLGWTHWETQGEFVDVVVLSKEVYFLVKRQDNYYIEKLEENTYTDHNVLIDGVKPETLNIVDRADNISDGADNIVDTDYLSGVAVSSITTNYADHFLSTAFKVVADFSIMPDSLPKYDGIGQNHFEITRDAYRLEVGLDFETKIVTLPISSTLNSGSTYHRRKRVVKVDINAFESLGVYARNIYAPDRQFTVVLDKAPTPFTGFKEIYLLGYDRITQIEITQKEPLPLLLRAIGFEIAY